MDVGDRLRGLGLTKYEDLFRENDIDTEVLAELTESDLNRARRVARAPVGGPADFVWATNESPARFRPMWAWT
jgi:SAM domain (Sterile alpha motif)